MNLAQGRILPRTDAPRPIADEIRALRTLSDAEAAERLRHDGPNELPQAQARGIFRLVFEIVREPMIGLLVACCTVYLLLGDVREASVLVASVFVVIAISLYQTEKTERALDALRTMSSPRALVIREGRERRIAGREVVCGDLIVLSEGDRVPADGVVLWSRNLRVDESLLTGESAPVRKVAGDESAARARAGGDDTPFVYSGTLAVAGQGVARVRAAGAATELGRIGRSLRDVDPGETRLQGQVRSLVRVLAAGGIALCGGVVVVYGMTRHDWLGGILGGLALAMSMMPEEFPVILTLFLAVGAWRIARRNVLVRRMPALEALGATTILCVDKTGTLTENRMAVSVLSAGGEHHDLARHGGEPLPEPFHRLLEFAVLASQESPFDPMEQAINALAQAALAGTEHLHTTWTLVREYPLSRELLAMSHVWRSPEGSGWIVAAKGAPEAIADLCHLDGPRQAALATDAAALAGRGLRVLGVAAARFRSPTLPGEQHDFVFALVGLIGLADPVRATAPGSVAECYRAGIRTVMITGDYPGTARQIAAQIGLAARDEVISGAELDGMDDAELARRVRTVNVFARVVPEQKLRLMRALRAHGDVVAMTGDGVNDAPALKAADIGIAMGARGTDVAREAADLVLLDDDFSSITRAIRLGRRVYDNIKKGMAYVMAIHVPIAGLALLPVLLGWPLVLLPVHIVFLELIIDPACSIVFEAEPEEADVMGRPPRDPREPLFGRRAIGVALLQGLLALLVACGVLAIALGRGYGEDRTRSLAFSTLVLTNLGLILTNRSTSRTALAALRVRNLALWWVTGGALAVLLASLLLQPLRVVFRFATPSPVDLALVLAAAALALIGFEMLKRIPRPDRLPRPGRGKPVGRAALPLVVAALLSLAGARRAEAGPPAGATLYDRYCASCHGLAGRGDGPAAAALSPRPTDLTRLDTRIQDLMRQIDGRRTIRAHGTADMPVWGEVFEQSLIDEPHRRRTALLAVQALADYVHRLRREKGEGPR